MISTKKRKGFLFKSLINKLRKILGLYFLNDWELIKNKSFKNNFLKVNSHSNIVTHKNYVHLKLKYKFKNSWFFLGIRHEENNNNIFGYITINNSTFKQGRILPPTRIRWRIIHISKKGDLNLILEDMLEFENIKDIFLFKIPFFNAVNKIKRKISGETNLLVDEKTKFKSKWKLYNKLFGQKYLSKNLKSYDFWLNKVEVNFLKSLIKHKFKILDFSLPEFEKYNFEVKNDWIILRMNKDVILSKISQIAISWAISQEPKTLLFYGDEDSLDKDYTRSKPLFRPSWNKELFLSDPLYSSLWIFKKQLWNTIIKEIYSKREQNKKINPYEIIISSINYIADKKLEYEIKHIPIILGHNPIQEINNFNSKKLLELYKRNIKDYLTPYKNNKVDIHVDQKNNSLMYYYPIPKESFLSIIIPTKDNVDLLEKCIDSLLNKKPGCKVEIIIVNNNSVERSTYKYFDLINSIRNNDIDISIINYPKKFNYSAINNYAYNFTRGNVIALINNDIEVLTNNWGSTILSYATRQDIGCVGIKLIYPDNTIQHAGIILGIYGSAAYSHKNFKRFDLGHAGRLQKVQEISAVTGAFLAIKKEIWEELNGLNENEFPINYNDVDFCLRVKELGLKNIYIPFVEGIHYESKTRGKPKGKEFRSWKKEHKNFTKKWAKFIISDPAYHPALTKYKENWTLSFSKISLNLR